MDLLQISGAGGAGVGGAGGSFFNVLGPTAPRNFTFPDADATIARTDAGQTFTGVQIFTGVTGAGITINAGAATTDVQALSATQTFNNAAVTFVHEKHVITDTASAAGSLALQYLGGASGTTNLMSLSKSGALTVSVLTIDGGAGIDFSSSTLYVRRATAAYAFKETADGMLRTTRIRWDDSIFDPGDTSLDRISAGVLGVGTGAVGSFAGSLKLTTLTHVSAEVDLSYSYNTPVTGATITTVTGEQRTIVNPAGTIAALTITTPPSPVEGQIWGAASTQIVTVLTITGTAGATVVAPFTSFAVDGNFRVIYRAAITSWLPAP